MQGKKIIHLKLCVFAFSLPPVNVEWTVIQYPLKLIHPSCKPVYSHAAFVMRYANNGQVIAVAANQENPMHTGVLFASPLCDTVLPVSLKGCGSRDPYAQTGRSVVNSKKQNEDNLSLTGLKMANLIPS